ncbi:LysR family transcriptional regulator [Actinopolyspora mortivallis]|uniref:LysR family transcriptional regulator n=1 Tax=Actinopolyspora mortivallis TaxID=33906 RepID=A0A2T0GW75_ACTMO|nr:LysR substrate-binding domain-containing protein [Actinopolyspora mortivallis]PRW63347.1 LysR family transcriptional regulator [Actinopolyspora mortivallis]
MDLQQLRYALAVAEEGSFTRAAARCMIAQPALSQQIGNLEHEFGAKLFDRSVRPTRPTAAGEVFLPRARTLLADAEELYTQVNAAAGRIRGPLHVGSISTLTAVSLPAVLREYRALHPHVHVDLRMGMSEELLANVRQGRLHVAFVGTVPDAPLHGVRYRRLAFDELVAVTAPGHRLDNAVSPGSRAGLDEIAKEPGVDFTKGTGARNQSDTAFAAQGLHREVIYEVSSAELLAQLTAAGLGVGMLPEPLARTLPGLRVIHLESPPARVESLVWPSGQTTPAVSAFLAAVGPEKENVDEDSER